MEDVNLFNVKAKEIHCKLENEIKQCDRAYEMSRADMLGRFVEAAVDVADWSSLYYQLTEFKNAEKGVLVPHFTNWQAKYDDETKTKLTKIHNNMQCDLQSKGIIARVLQTQLMLQLLMFNYLQIIKIKKFVIKMDDDISPKADLSLPEMTALLTEVILTDRESDTLKQICRLLIDWRGSYGKGV